MSRMTSRRQHRMPYGTYLQEDGGVTFRLWAPAARQVDVCLETTGSDILLPLQAETGGWYTLTTDKAKAGTLYRYRIDNQHHVPDPAARFQPRDVHGPSCIIDPLAWTWHDANWQGRPWNEAVIYELHVGTFSPRGDYRGVEERLQHLAELGVTAIELMPLADFPGRHGWGYDGVLLFAPDAAYGPPEDLKHLVATAHNHGIMVILDVVYNHFGPEGNYLHLYAPQFFHPRYHTPWGVAMNFAGKSSHWVRQFFIHNALYWLNEYHMDGLRLDAVQAMLDTTHPSIIEELATAVQKGPGAERHIHLILENDDNAARLLQPKNSRRYNKRDGTTEQLHPSTTIQQPSALSTLHPVNPDARSPVPGNPDPEAELPRCQAQWNDDLHHVLHHILTGEIQGYYLDFQHEPLHHLGRALAEGFAFQGEASPYRDNRPRGEGSAYLSPAAFVSFLQNHDQVGNRLGAERIVTLAPPEAVRAVTVLLLLAPQIPMLFMGQEWGCTQPFPFFCDLHPDLAPTIAQGRHREFLHYFRFHNLKTDLPPLPHPMAPATVAMARLDWQATATPASQAWLALHKKLLALRRQEILPRLALIGGHAGKWQVHAQKNLEVSWSLHGGSSLVVMANLSPDPAFVQPPVDRLLHATHVVDDHLPPWFVGWYERLASFPFRIRQATQSQGVKETVGKEETTPEYVPAP
ncbi:MAG: DUF3459 domain-containing protein [Magnetococcales bacterium]|nr:DUF3459 domain-containing protein [Magnetococcales bacterium]